MSDIERPEVFGPPLAETEYGEYGGPLTEEEAEDIERPEVFGPPLADTETGATPTHAAHKADWVAYAVSQGADPDDAEAATKTELIEQYG